MVEFPLVSPDNPRWRVRRTALVLLKLAVSVTLLAVLLRRADLGTLANNLRSAEPGWMAVALLLYGLMLVVSAWRWQQLLDAQRVRVGFGKLFESFLVATFFNNFLPSNVGGDVVRVVDTSKAAGSKTLATTVVLLDRGLGLLGLFLVGAIAASLGRWSPAGGDPVGATTLWAGLVAGTAASIPLLLAPQVLQVLVGPIRRIHPEWVDERVGQLTAALIRFRRAPAAMLSCFAGAIAVQAILVLFYAALARGLHIEIGLIHLALLVPVSFLVQMIPISINGFGVREATFGVYFQRLGLPLDAALLLSLSGAAAILALSILGGGAYVARLRHHRASFTA
jgi:uncharacterized membrane protein YbhN (UPF0104 family)